MNDAVIVSTARTGLAKSFRGSFNATYGAAMGAMWSNMRCPVLALMPPKLMM